MFEANTKKWEATILERGIERGIEQGIERGIGRGIEQGIEKRDLEIVDKMIRNGMSDAEIRKITGMPTGKISILRKRTEVGRTGR